jgi:SAM-dependent methyltransferase
MTNNKSGKAYRPVVERLLRNMNPQLILDAPSGEGWLRGALNDTAILDGVDLSCPAPKGYRNFWNIDFASGLPDALPRYDCVVCCEILAYIGNPLTFLKSVHARLVADGTIVISTPSVWYPQSRIQFLFRGYFPAVPSWLRDATSAEPGHITPITFPNLYMYLTQSGFKNIQLHSVQKGPKHWFEWIVGIPQWMYCRSQLRKAITDEAIAFWKTAGSRSAIYERQMVVSAQRQEREAYMPERSVDIGS